MVKRWVACTIGTRILPRNGYRHKIDGPALIQAGPVFFISIGFVFLTSAITFIMNVIWKKST